MQKKILLWFEDEDYLTPESDDALLELLSMLEESGVKAHSSFAPGKWSFSTPVEEWTF